MRISILRKENRMFDGLLEKTAAEGAAISRAVVSGENAAQHDTATQAGLRLAQRLMPIAIIGLLLASDPSLSGLCGRGCAA
jgi:hypothetical protein